MRHGRTTFRSPIVRGMARGTEQARTRVFAERCLGHGIPGVRGIYDRHEYFEEKAQAFEALAAQVQRIMILSRM
jgi:hypothetical protein